jgi:hypothetical protein
VPQIYSLSLRNVEWWLLVASIPASGVGFPACAYRTIKETYDICLPADKYFRIGSVLLDYLAPSLTGYIILPGIWESPLSIHDEGI